MHPLQQYRGAVRARAVEVVVVRLHAGPIIAIAVGLLIAVAGVLLLVHEQRAAGRADRRIGGFSVVGCAAALVLGLAAVAVGVVDLVGIPK